MLHYSSIYIIVMPCNKWSFFFPFYLLWGLRVYIASRTVQDTQENRFCPDKKTQVGRHSTHLCICDLELGDCQNPTLTADKWPMQLFGSSHKPQSAALPPYYDGRGECVLDGVCWHVVGAFSYPTSPFPNVCWWLGVSGMWDIWDNDLDVWTQRCCPLRQLLWECL